MNCAVHTQTQAVAFCRTCGKALCEDCKRDVMGAIYCEPCIAARLQGSAAPAGTGFAPPVAHVPGAPNPVMAGLLGFVPGVGAMYNGQFIKAFVHVVIFVMLILACNISGLFGIGIGFFVLYMAFEAFKTAEAKRLGMPVPDPLGLDRMFGLQETQHSAPAGAATPYVAGIPTPPPLQVEPLPPQPRDNAPIGAIVLIALGLMFLLSNLNIFNFGIDRLWPLFLVGIGLWTAYKRTSRQTCPCVRCRVKGMMGPAVLITLGVLFLLQTYYIASFDKSLPVLLLVIGCILLVSRTGSTEGHVGPVWTTPAPPPPAQQPWATTTTTTTGVGAPPPASQSQAWTTPSSNNPVNPDDPQVKP